MFRIQFHNNGTTRDMVHGGHGQGMYFQSLVRYAFYTARHIRYKKSCNSNCRKFGNSAVFFAETLRHAKVKINFCLIFDYEFSATAILPVLSLFSICAI